MNIIKTTIVTTEIKIKILQVISRLDKIISWSIIGEIVSWLIATFKVNDNYNTNKENLIRLDYNLYH